MDPGDSKLLHGSRKQGETADVPVRCALAVGLAAAASAQAPAHAARPVQPPLTELTRNYDFVLVAEAESREGANRIIFRRVEKLFAEGEPIVTVRMDEDTRADVKVGETYIVAYTTITNEAPLRDHKYVDPAGP